jgi:hypothetical protein
MDACILMVNIRQITVTGEASIVPGSGINGVNLGDPWDTVSNYFNSADTLLMVDTSGGYYLHWVYYYNAGIAVLFVNSDSTVIANNDRVYVINLVTPYVGNTANGIMLGSDISAVEAAYGTPVMYQGSSYYLYYYDAIGIQFWTALKSTAVEEIDVYYPASMAKSTAVQKSTLPYAAFRKRLLSKLSTPQSK